MEPDDIEVKGQQSIKQLPARSPVGVVVYSVYSRACDLGNGISWYTFTGVDAALFTVVAAVALFEEIGSAQVVPIYVADTLSIRHTIVTTWDAPTMHSQRRYANDEQTLAALFDRYARWQALRALLQVLTFGTLLWALTA